MKAAAPSNELPGLSVRFPPVWNHIVPLTQYVSTFLEAKGRADSAERTGIVVHELLENAVKYGDPASEVKLELSADIGQPIVVRVTNRAHASRVTILERELRRMQGVSPRDAFARALERLQHLPEGSTMLGLARVMIESELDVHVVAGTVVITARLDTSAARLPNTGAKAGTAISYGSRADAVPPSSSDVKGREASPSNVSQTRRLDRPPSGTMKAPERTQSGSIGAVEPTAAGAARAQRVAQGGTTRAVVEAASPPRGPLRK